MALNHFAVFVKTNIKKIIYASSSSVYSDSCDKKFSEQSTRKDPKSLYGLSKLLNEKYASNLADRTNISVIGLRFFSVYGPYGRPDMAYYLFSEAIMHDKELVLNNKGRMLGT